MDGLEGFASAPSLTSLTDERYEEGMTAHSYLSLQVGVEFMS